MSTSEPKTGVQLITEERQRQIEVEGWTPDHDDEHGSDALADGAAAYALSEDAADNLDINVTHVWPFASWWYKPTTRLRDLVKAGAMIAAAIDCYQREQQRTTGTDEA